METKNYKRTVAGSVGAGMGALFNASGRTYFMLEHKTNTKYHNAGDTQKIIIDQVELGRDGGCQVRFDESCETVSRKHAAIVKEGENWKIVHLSHSNPTFVNGQPVQERILVSGDEIQLSVGGPRMGFIVPQGKQALTSSIGLTERMNLFRQQALAPYKRALWAMAILLVAVVACFGYWNYNLTQQNKALMADIEMYEHRADSLINAHDALVTEMSNLDDKIAHSSGAQRTIYIRQREAVSRQIQQNEAQQHENAANLNEARSAYENTTGEAYNQITYNNTPSSGNEEVNSDDRNDTPVSENDGAVSDIDDYTDCVYTLKIDNIKVSYDDVDIPHGIANPGVVGNGFLIDNGNFVTARQNVQPWIYSGVVTDGRWRDELAQYYAIGCDIEIQYSAYSAKGTAKKLQFNSREFKYPDNYVTRNIEVSKSIRTIANKFGISVNYVEKHSVSYKQFASTSNCFAVIRGLANTGIPTASTSVKGGQELTIAGYTGKTDVQNLGGFSYMNSHTIQADNGNDTYILQEQSGGNHRGYLGSPAFIKDDNGKHRVIGVYVGTLFGHPRIVPISKCR